MLKNAKLSTRLGLAFGAMIAITATICIISWYGVRELDAGAKANDIGNHIQSELITAGMARRDFALRGFDKGADGKTAEDSFRDVHQVLNEKLKELQALPTLADAYRGDVAESLRLSDEYLAAFDQQVEARKARDAAFKEWSRVGWAVTKSTSTLVQETLLPKLATALEAQDLTEVNRLAGARAGLDEDVLQNFLLLRVTAVYLIVTQADAQWDGYQKQLANMRAGLTRWTQALGADADLAPVAKELEGYIGEYEAAGTEFHNGILADRAAGATMSDAAGKILAKIVKLQDNLESDMGKATTRIELTVVVMAIVAVVVGVALAWT
ncbi:MAG TPA: hypothetical protein P5572_20745, partial [Phycisphaerae bacterium]|nr:hypothetical protein [Phycisphaerae bacterium]